MAAAEQDPNDFVYIKLASHGADVPPGRVTRQSFDDYWKAKGWVLVSDEDAATAQIAAEEPTTEKRGK